MLLPLKAGTCPENMGASHGTQKAAAAVLVDHLQDVFAHRIQKRPICAKHHGAVLDLLKIRKR